MNKVAEIHIPGPSFALMHDRLVKVFIRRDKFMHFKMLIVFLSALFCSGCSIGRLKSIEDVADNEVVAIGRARVIYNGSDRTKGANLIFNAPTNGFPKYQCILDESGYVFTKLPREHVYLTNLVHPTGLITKRLDRGEVATNLQSKGKVCYIGDIHIEWHGLDEYEARRRSTGAALGMMFSSKPYDGNLKITVESRDLSIVQREFQIRHKNNLHVVSALLKSSKQ